MQLVEKLFTLSLFNLVNIFSLFTDTLAFGNTFSRSLAGESSGELLKGFEGVQIIQSYRGKSADNFSKTKIPKTCERKTKTTFAAVFKRPKLELVFVRRKLFVRNCKMAISQF